MSGYRDVEDRVAEAARRSGRPASSVRIVGAAKAQSVETVIEACRAGLREIGENYAQEAADKVPRINARLRDEGLPLPVWHFLGGLQSNKARQVVPWCACIQSLDRQSLAKALDRRAASEERVLDVLIQVNVSGERSKGGVDPARLAALLDARPSWSHLRVIGLMSIPAPAERPEDARRPFAALRELLEKHREAADDDLRHLSMGMSGDFETAIEEGATIVRIGTAIFGARVITQ